MTNQSTGQLPKPQPDSAKSGNCGTGSGETPPAAVPTLTFSRGTRPLNTRRPANGDLHGYRRRSA